MVIYLPTISEVASLAQGQSYDCPNASKATLKDSNATILPHSHKSNRTGWQWQDYPHAYETTVKDMGKIVHYWTTKHSKMQIVYMIFLRRRVRSSSEHSWWIHMGSHLPDRDKASEFQRSVSIRGILSQ